jgi:hypothetical protein
MPFAESDDYVRQLVESTTEKALQQPMAKVHSLRIVLAAAAAIVLLIAGIGITYYNKVIAEAQLTAQQTESPMEQFLNGLTDEEVQLLAYYEIEEIPEENYKD